MAKKTSLARLAGAAVAATGALALIAPAVATADAVAVPAPTVTAQVSGDAIEMTVTAPDTDANIACVPIVLSATDALPLAALPTDQWPGFGDMLGQVYYVGSPTVPGAPASEGTTATPEDGVNTGLLKPITPGAYAVVGACVDAEAQDAILSYSYQIVFFPGGFGSLSQALDLGSTTISMEGGSSVIAEMLANGAGSGMLTSNLS